MENTPMFAGAIVRSLVSEGCHWTIYEQSPMHVHQQNALIFMSERIARRVIGYPSNWFELPDDILAEIGTDVILTRRITYAGPGPFNGYIGFAPDNGGGGWLRGVEMAYTQRFVALPGRLGGLGFDGNWTHTESRILVDPDAGRKAPLLRQSPNIANAYLTYDQWPFSARVGWTYNGAMINAYGDGTPTANGDNYFYPHAQVDGSFVFNATQAVQLQFMVLNINNAVFGFYQGTPGHEFSFQREYYGPTFFFGTKIGF